MNECGALNVTVSTYPKHLVVPGWVTTRGKYVSTTG